MRRRLIAALLLLTGTTVAAVVQSTPAQAAYVYQGTYVIRWSAFDCFGVFGNGRSNGTQVVLTGCNTAAASQQWAVYQTGSNVYQINAYAGEQPLNMCLDGPDSSAFVTIYGCHGQHQQRFAFNGTPTSNFSTQLKLEANSDCLGIIGVLPSNQPSIQHGLSCGGAAASFFTLTRVR